MDRHRRHRNPLSRSARSRPPEGAAVNRVESQKCPEVQDRTLPSCGAPGPRATSGLLSAHRVPLVRPKTIQPAAKKHTTRPTAADTKPEVSTDQSPICGLGLQTKDLFLRAPAKGDFFQFGQKIHTALCPKRTQNDRSVVRRGSSKSVAIDHGGSLRNGVASQV
jgi:hypothetical protein